MFVQIQETRIKISSIGEYRKGSMMSNNKWYLEVRVSGKTRSFAFDTQQEQEQMVTHLDSVCNVKRIWYGKENRKYEFFKLDD